MGKSRYSSARKSAFVDPARSGCALAHHCGYVVPVLKDGRRTLASLRGRKAQRAPSARQPHHRASGQALHGCPESNLCRWDDSNH